MSGASTYDRAELEDEKGNKKKVSRTEFLNLPIDQRIRSILTKKVKFFLGEQEISSRDAMRGS